MPSSISAMPGGMAEHDLDPAGRREPPEAGLGVQRHRRRRVPSASGIGCAGAYDEERLADMSERDRLDVVERFDRRVLAVAAARPGAEQRRDVSEAGMERRQVAAVQAVRPTCGVGARCAGRRSSRRRA